MLDDAVIGALQIARSALLVDPSERGPYQRSCIILAAEIHRLNVEIGELYRHRTPAAKQEGENVEGKD